MRSLQAAAADRLGHDSYYDDDGDGDDLNESEMQMDSREACDFEEHSEPVTKIPEEQKLKVDNNKKFMHPLIKKNKITPIIEEPSSDSSH